MLGGDNRVTRPGLTDRKNSGSSRRNKRHVKADKNKTANEDSKPKHND